MSDYAVTTHGLRREFGSKVAVENLDLAVAEGEFFGFLGPNGAGKSTTIKMLVGLLRPTAGNATIAGYDVWRQPLLAKRQLGVLPEGLNLYDRLTGREFVEFVGTMYGVDAQVIPERTAELLELVDLTDDADTFIVDYSQGMRKKTALAAAIIHRPRVLFLDEPFEGVDAISGRAIRAVLQRLVAGGTTIFFSSHILEVVERLCTRVAVINEGRLVAEGTMEALRSQAETGAQSSLEDIFLRAVGAAEETGEEGKLTWLD